MPLADKIIELRKKQGWSQIDLADRLDVSRQSVSKWEMAQAVPELDKIIKMSELFAVTTDYLLKDNVPAPEPAAVPEPAEPAPEPPAPAPSPEPESVPSAAKRARRKWPWVLAACLVLALVLNWAGALAYRDAYTTSPPFPLEEFPQPSPTPAPMPAAEETVIEEPAAPSLEQTAVFDLDGPEAGMTECAYEENACTAGGIDKKELAAIAAEYEPFGITCDEDGGQWYFEGKPIRVFTDILTSNGESLTGGNFRGVIRNYAGEGEIDVRTVRDYEHCNERGSGTLLYVEFCPTHGDAVWTECYPDGHHSGEHH